MAAGAARPRPRRRRADRTCSRTPGVPLGQRVQNVADRCRLQAAAASTSTSTAKRTPPGPPSADHDAGSRTMRDVALAGIVADGRPGPRCLAARDSTCPIAVAGEGEGDRHRGARRQAPKLATRSLGGTRARAGRRRCGLDRSAAISVSATLVGTAAFADLLTSWSNVPPTRLAAGEPVTETRRSGAGRRTGGCGLTLMYGKASAGCCAHR